MDHQNTGRLLLDAGTAGSRQFELKPGLNTVGRHADNMICIPDSSVSGHHCELTVSHEGVLVHDLGSTNGTFIDEVPVTKSTLNQGQTLKLGNVVLRFESGGTALSQGGRGPIRVQTAGVQAPPKVLKASSGVRLQVPLPPSKRAVESVPLPPPPTNLVASRATDPETTGAPIDQQVQAPVEEGGQCKCSIHRRSLARFRCPTCGNYFCGLCVNTPPGSGQKNCRTCGTACVPLKMPVRPEPKGRGFFGDVVDALVYPFRGSGLVILVMAVVLFAVLHFLRFGIIGLLIQIAATGYFFAYMQNIVHATVAREEKMPDFPDFDGVFGAAFELIMIVLVSFGLAIALGVSRVLSNTPPEWAVNVALGLGCVYFPMAFLAVAMKDTVAAANPLFVIPSIVNAGARYIGAAGLVLAAFFVRQSGDVVFTQLPGELSFLVVVGLRAGWSFIGFYLITVSMRALGQLYLARKQQLGWFDHV